MNRRLLFAVCCLAFAFSVIFGESTIGLWATALLVIAAGVLLFRNIETAGERRWVFSFFAAAALAWTVVEVDRDLGRTARLAGFWTFIALSVTAVAPSFARFARIVIVTFFGARHLRRILQSKPANLNEAKSFMMKFKT